MDQRLLKVAKGLTRTAIAVAATWLLSWLMQYIAAITINGQSLHLNRAANRLALTTVIAAVIIMAVITFVIVVVDDWDFIIILACVSIMAMLVGGVNWVTQHIFPGTTIATVPAQWIYGIVTLVWGIAMWYIFLSGITSELSEN